MFNRDMDMRLADLQRASEQGEAIAFERLGEHVQPPHEHLPERVMVSFGQRRFVFDLPMARMVADQLEVNGFAATAARLREVAA